MRIVIRASMAPQRELDVTSAIVAAVAHELWKNFGGNDVVNWMEAERIVARMALPERGAPGRAAGGELPKLPPREKRTRTTTLHPALESSEDAAAYR